MYLNLCPHMKHPFKKSHKFLQASISLRRCGTLKVMRVTFLARTMTGVWQDIQWPWIKMENVMQCARTIPQNKEVSQPNDNRSLPVEKYLLLTRMTCQTPLLSEGSSEVPDVQKAIVLFSLRRKVILIKLVSDCNFTFTLLFFLLIWNFTKWNHFLAVLTTVLV